MKEEKARAEAKGSVKEQLKAYEIELCLSRQLTTKFLASHDEIGSRVAKMRRKFARQYGFVVPEIKLTDDFKAPAKTYQIRIHGTVVATQELRLGEFLVIVGDGKVPNVPGDEVREPAFGMKAIQHFRGLPQRCQATRLQHRRFAVGAAHPFERGDPQQSVAACSPTRTCAPCSTGWIPNTSA